MSLTRTLVKGFRTHLPNPGWSSHLDILRLIMSAKTLLPKKVTFRGSRDQDVDISFWGVAIQPTTGRQTADAPPIYILDFMTLQSVQFYFSLLLVL